MTLIFRLILLTVGVVLAGWWLSGNPGYITLQWLGYEIRAHVGVLFIVLLVLLAGLWVLSSVLMAVARLPWRRRLYMHEKKHMHGLNALALAMTELAQNNPASAQKALAQAEHYLPNHHAIAMLRARLAYQQGDEVACRQALHQLAQNPDSRRLAERALAKLSYQHGDIPQAITHARRAADAQDKAASFMLLSLYVRQDQFDSALKLLKKMKLSRVTPDANTLSQSAIEALIYYEHSKHDEARRVHLLRSACDANAGFVPAVRELLAEYLGHTPHRSSKQARKLWAKAWRALPHPDYIPYVQSLLADHKPEKHSAIVRQLVEASLPHPLSQQLLAEYALYAEDKTAAHNHLKAIAPAHRNADVVALEAKLAALEGRPAPSVVANSLLAQPGWYCKRCQALHADHQTHCRSCDAFMGVEWMLPNTMTQARADDIFGLL